MPPKLAYIMLQLLKIQLHSSFYNEGGPLEWLKETWISMRERKKLSQKYELCTKSKVYITIFLDKGNVDIVDFWK